MHYVYIIKSTVADKVYTGVTTDLQRRINEHNYGKSRHTSKYRPWELVTYVAFKSEALARNFEAYLKTGSGIAFARKRLFD